MPSSTVSWGIEVGAGAVKALRLVRDGDAVRVDDFVVVPHKRVLSTPDLDQHDATRLAVGALMSEYRDAMRGTAVVTSVPGHSAFARFAKLPPVEPKKIPNMVRYEAAQQIPFPIDEVEWDYQAFASDDSPEVEVGIFAVHRDRVNERLHLYDEVQLTCDQITLGPLAAYNAIAYDLGFTEDTPGTVILDIGTTASDLIVAERGRVWVRTFPLGGHHFTEALAETFKLTYPKAEKLKREAETSKYKRHVFQALKPVLSDLVQRVQESIGYYQSMHDDADLSRLIGLGSTFRLLGLRKLLSQQLKLEVYRLERFKALSVEGPGEADFEAAALNMATAYGLALQGLGLTPIRANLMPVPVIRAAMWKRKTPWFVAAAGIGVAGAATSFIRPFLDSQDLPDLSREAAVSRVISDGNRLKSEWSTISAEHQPAFRAANVVGLLERRDLYARVLDDVAAMLASAPGGAGGQAEGGPAFRLGELRTRYLAPGTPLPTGTDAPAGDRGGRGPSRFQGTDPFGGDPYGAAGPYGDVYGGDEFGARDGRGGGGPGAEGGGAGAGERGAVRVTVSVEFAQEQDRTFFNDTVLAWLRDQVNNPAGRTLQIVSAPTIDEAVRQVVSRSDEGGQPRAPAEPMFQGEDRFGGAPGGEPGRWDTGRDRSDGFAGQRGRGSAGGVRGLDELAPLPEPPDRFDDGATIVRYTVSWTAQILDEPIEAPTGEADGEPAEAGGEPRADASAWGGDEAEGRVTR